MIVHESRPFRSSKADSRLSKSSSVRPQKYFSLIWRAASKIEVSTIASNAFSTRIHLSGAFLIFFPFSLVDDRLNTLLPMYFSLVTILRTLVLVHGRP